MSNALTKGKHAVVKSQTGVVVLGVSSALWLCWVTVTSFFVCGNLTHQVARPVQSAGFVIVAERVNM